MKSSGNFGHIYLFLQMRFTGHIDQFFSTHIFSVLLSSFVLVPFRYRRQSIDNKYKLPLKYFLFATLCTRSVP